MVIDSFDVFRNASQYIGVELKDLILSRNGVFVARLDSGDPKMTIKTIFNILFEKFDYTVNTKGFKVLPPQLRVLQSDGMNLETIREIYEMLFEEKIAAENFVIGIGGKLLQAGIDRDTQNFAIKACYAIIDGEEFEIVKSPKEMDSNGDINISFKKSKKGLMKLVKNDNNEYTTLLKTDYPLMFDDMKDELITVFEDGELLVDYTFEEIRERAKK
jgi:nicotinamide phosphoribosyltransferase